MKITLKNLQQQTFVIDIEPTKTVCDFLKQDVLFLTMTVAGQGTKAEDRKREGQGLPLR